MADPTIVKWTRCILPSRISGKEIGAMYSAKGKWIHPGIK